MHLKNNDVISLIHNVHVLLSFGAAFQWLSG